MGANRGCDKACDPKTRSRAPTPARLRPPVLAGNLQAQPILPIRDLRFRVTDYNANGANLASIGDDRPFIVIPAKAQGCPGKMLRSNKRGNRPNNFVLSGLVPAIQAFEEPKERRGCADQVRARRLGGDVSVDNPLLLQEKFPRTTLREGGSPGQKGPQRVVPCSSRGGPGPRFRETDFIPD